MFNILINAMEAPIFTSQQFYDLLPVGLVIILAVLVFAFGFKSSVEPPSFKHISVASEDRKNTKKKKAKDKKPQTNGHAVVIDLQDTKSKTELLKPAKPTKQAETPKQKKATEVEKAPEKKIDVQKSPVKKEKKAGKENEGKNKKNQHVEKPADFDEGEWEVAPSRKDKKNKKKDEQDGLPTYSPEKVSKRKGGIGNKKDAEKVTIIDAKPMETLKIEDIMPQLKHEAAQAVASVIAESNFEISTIASAAPVPSVVATPETTVVIPASAVDEVSEEQAVKKKKNKKTKSVSEPETVDVAEAEVPAPELSKVESATGTSQVFNELEDAWKEAPQKKSKKKVRKD